MAVRKLGNSEPLEQTSISGQHCLDHTVISGRQNVINREIEPGIHLSIAGLSNLRSGAILVWLAYQDGALLC